MNWGHSSLAMKSRQSDLLKRETVKTVGTPRKINRILLKDKSTKIDKHMWIYTGNKLEKNFTKIYLDQVKIFQKVLGELLFLTHTVPAAPMLWA